MNKDVEVFSGAGQLDAMDMVKSGEIMRQDKTPYTTAISVVKPREIQKVMRQVFAEVELDPESAYYEWNVNDRNSKTGKKTVTGGSIGLAMSIARNYGNSAVVIQVDEFPTHFVFTPAFIDIETGFTFQRAFRMSKKNDNLQNYNDERRADMLFQIGQSKAIRNVILGAAPAALKNKAIEHAKYILVNNIDAEGIEKSRERAIKEFQKIGITKEQLIIYTDISDPSKWDSETVAKLYSIYKAIKNGDVDAEEAFPPIVAQDKQAPTETVKPEDVTLSAKSDPEQKPEDKSKTQKNMFTE